MSMKSSPVTIHFKTELYALKDWTVLSIPKDESKKLPSRGQISVTGKINGHDFKTVLEPDGNWSHWMRVTDEQQKSMKVEA